VLLPVWPKLLDVQGSILYGNGIGRYASGQLPDVTIAPDGSLTALRELQSMIGAVLHIMPDLDLYSYAGVERAAASYTVNTNGISGVNIGYGNPFYSNAACLLENYGGPFTPAVGGNVVTASESNGTCAVNTRQLAELTAGFWYNLYRGLWGRVAFGMQLEYIHRDVFSASAAVAAKNGFAALPAANLAPATDIGIIMSSLRFYF